MRNNYNKGTFQQHIAFTLAEVLITLGIIGVVAAMTIPTLMNNSQKKQYVVGLKKAYSTWNQALVQMANDAGCPGDLSCFFDSGDADVMGNKMVKYFKTVKICPQAGSVKGCFPDEVASNIDGTGKGAGYDDGVFRFITTDGMAVMFFSPVQDCDYHAMGAPGTAPGSVCNSDSLYIDVNGLKLPNTIGRDIFQFWITNGKGPQLYPTGGPDTGIYFWKGYSCDYGYNSGTVIDGADCAARIMEQGWEMKY